MFTICARLPSNGLAIWWSLTARPARWSAPRRRWRWRCGIVYFHGGGFGWVDSHDDVCAEICAATGYDVIAVDLLAPEHRHPAMFDDALAATWHVLATSSLPLLLCDSAGGNLAAAVARAL